MPLRRCEGPSGPSLTLEIDMFEFDPDSGDEELNEYRKTTIKNYDLIMDGIRMKAIMRRRFYEELREQGFTKDQALIQVINGPF